MAITLPAGNNRVKIEHLAKNAGGLSPELGAATEGKGIFSFFGAEQIQDQYSSKWLLPYWNGDAHITQLFADDLDENDTRKIFNVGKAAEYLLNKYFPDGPASPNYPESVLFYMHLDFQLILQRNAGDFDATKDSLVEFYDTTKKVPAIVAADGSSIEMMGSLIARASYYVPDPTFGDSIAKINAYQGSGVNYRDSGVDGLMSGRIAVIGAEFIYQEID